MLAPVHVQLVHDPHRNPAIIGWTTDPVLLRMTAQRLIREAEERAAQFSGINDLLAEQERAEAERLRRLLALVLPDDGGDE